MPKLRTYIVSFSPAEITPHGFTTTISLLVGNENHTFQADSLPAMEAEVRRLAREFGQTCAPYIRVPRGERSPPGFDKFVYHGTLRCIEFVPPAEG